MNLWGKKELIGSIIEIVGSNNKSLIGLKGIVINETKNTIEIDNGKKILKSHVKIKIKDTILDGKKLQKRPEDRIKK